MFAVSIGGRDSAYHARVADAFGDMARAEPARFAVIHGNAPREEVADRILGAVLPLVDQC